MAFQLNALCPWVDLISVGSNDLCQFLFASDRGNSRLADRFDILSPIILTVLKNIVTACDKANVPLSLCGEMAGQPLEAMAFIGLESKRLSMASSSISPVKEMVLGMDMFEVQHALSTLFDSPEHSLREALALLAKEQGLSVNAGALK